MYVNKRLYGHIVFPSNSTAWTVCSQRSCVVLVTQRFICAVLLQCATPAMCYDPSPHYLHTKHYSRYKQGLHSSDTGVLTAHSPCSAVAREHNMTIKPFVHTHTRPTNLYFTMTTTRLDETASFFYHKGVTGLSSGVRSDLIENR